MHECAPYMHHVIAYKSDYHRSIIYTNLQLSTPFRLYTFIIWITEMTLIPAYFINIHDIKFNTHVHVHVITHTYIKPNLDAIRLTVVEL